MHGLRSNTLESLWQWFCQQISDQYDSTEAGSIARLVFEHLFDISPMDRFINKERRFRESEIIDIYRIIKRLQTHEPIQQILGYSFFRGLKLKVSPSVLIPRQETEELVEWILTDASLMDSRAPKKIWDIGTGSGALAISLYREIKPSPVIIASDISSDALSVARENSQNHLCKIDFIQNDILANTHYSIEHLDCIVSNPPYVRESEKDCMQNHVLDYDPHLALFVKNENPLIFYKAISKTASKTLKPGGKIYFEINEALALETSNCISQEGFIDIQIKKDMQGKDRFIRASMPL